MITRRIPSVFLVFLTLVVLLSAVRASAFTEPREIPYDYPLFPLPPPPVGNTLAPPLNVSGIAQDKSGRLEILGDVTVGHQVVAKKFCIGLNCVENWDAFTDVPDRYVNASQVLNPPFPPPEEGAPALEANAIQTAAFTAQGAVGNNPVDIMAGGRGENASSSGAGILGIAGNGSSNRQYGVLGTSIGFTAYSGYFKGQLRANGKAYFFPDPQAAKDLALSAGTVNIDASQSTGGFRVVDVQNPPTPTLTFDIEAGQGRIESIAQSLALNPSAGPIRIYGDLKVDPDDNARLNVCPNASPGHNPDRGGIILNGECRNTWPAGGPSLLWEQDAAMIYPQEGADQRDDVIRNEDVILGDASYASAPMRLEVTNGKRSWVLVKGAAAGYGTTTGVSMVIGDPEEGLDPLITCGDGVCNNGETFEAGPNQCLADCTP